MMCRAIVCRAKPKPMRALAAWAPPRCPGMLIAARRQAPRCSGTRIRPARERASMVAASTRDGGAMSSMPRSGGSQHALTACAAASAALPAVAISSAAWKTVRFERMRPDRRRRSVLGDSMAKAPTTGRRHRVCRGSLLPWRQNLSDRSARTPHSSSPMFNFADAAERPGSRAAIESAMLLPHRNRRGSHRRARAERAHRRAAFYAAHHGASDRPEVAPHAARRISAPEPEPGGQPSLRLRSRLLTVKADRRLGSARLQYLK